MENHHQHVIRFAGLVAGALMLFGAVGTVTSAQRQPPQFQLPDQAAHWRAGDVIFRRGVGPEAAVVRSVDSSGYTHVGMLVGAHPDWQVIHAEPEEKGAGGKVEIIPLRQFMGRDHAIIYGVYRVEANDAQRASALANAADRLGTPFDAGYSFRDDSAIYCTELVVKAYQTVNVKVADWSRAIRPFLADEPILTPEGILHSGRLAKVGD